MTLRNTLPLLSRQGRNSSSTLGRLASSRSAQTLEKIHLNRGRTQPFSSGRQAHVTKCTVLAIQSRTGGTKLSNNLQNDSVSRHNSALLSIQGRRWFHASRRDDAVVPFLLADVGEGITECEVTQWFVQPGSKVAQFDKICEVQSDKASVEITSRFDGVIKSLHYKVGDMAKVGSPLVDIETKDGSKVETPATPPSSPTASSTAAAQPSTTPKPAIEQGAASAVPVVDAGEKVLTFATPAVRRIAKEYNIDLSKVQGTGKGGRIMKEDVLKFVESGGKETIAATAEPIASSPASPLPTPAASDELRPLTNIQKAMLKTMSKSLQIPHFVYSDEIILNNATQLRKQINRHVAAHSTMYPFKKISYMPILIKSFSLALQKYPLLNTMVVNPNPADPSSTKLLYRSSHNVGVAMDTPSGLVVPNIKNVQSKSILDIASDLHRLSALGKKNSIPPPDFQNGTITLSNIGAIGGTYMAPVIVNTEVCIGAIGKIQALPRFEMEVDPVSGEENEVVVKKEVMCVSFSADHRVVDGATVARFVQTWKQYVEDPWSMLTELK
ncbi:2-oxoacid dehydrogenases acyltransferase-domain-containing protein [Paraphysoderma sedebokerense]|nr:2-oxoacid dehydrogenases acyltransferase-domain-containing protein [Paraphysoderma sedebokerense]